jgi:hypothetical protein
MTASQEWIVSIIVIVLKQNLYPGNYDAFTQFQRKLPVERTAHLLKTAFASHMLFAGYVLASLGLSN